MFLFTHVLFCDLSSRYYLVDSKPPLQNIILNIDHAVTWLNFLTHDTKIISRLYMKICKTLHSQHLIYYKMDN